MARPANAHDNTLVRDFLITQIQTEGADPLGWLEYLLNGPERPTESINKPVSAFIVLRQLLAHKVITAKAVRTSLSRQKMVEEGELVNKRYALHVAAVIASVSKTVERHILARSEG
ncbi:MULTISPECIES: hypothetical protein [Pantoea]|uniref:hypothetical protein n=1 Tax=Pantoea TaxID=53335 RepID=UPI00065F901D|nr:MULTISPECIES: hypothetical protein [Pantoea]